MTRKQLEDLGLTKEQADSVMKINGDDIENAKVLLQQKSRTCRQRLKD